MKTLTFYIFAHDYMSTKKGTEHTPGFQQSLALREQ